MSPAVRPELVLRAVPGIGEVGAGTELATLLDDTDLLDGDVVVLTSKVVSKAEGRVVDGADETDRQSAVASETTRVLARRGPTTIARTRHGLVLAAAGVDTSNVRVGALVLLPLDPDASARRVRDDLASRHGVNVAVVVSDTAGRAWRVGQTDIAIGAAGLRVLDDHAGRQDSYGNALAVTLPAVADEVAGAAELATGKLSLSPLTLVRGLASLVLPRGEHGPGAAALVRPEAEDMFGLGAREAVLAALGPARTTAFGAPASADAVATALTTSLGVATGSWVVTPDGDLLLDLGHLDERAVGRAETVAEAVARAHGWRRSEAGGRQVRLSAGP